MKTLILLTILTLAPVAGFAGTCDYSKILTSNPAMYECKDEAGNIYYEYVNKWEDPQDANPDFPCCNIPKEFSNLNLKDCQLCPKDQAVEDDNKWQEDCDFWLDSMKQTKNDKDFLLYANVSTAFCTRALLEEMRKDGI